GKAEPITNRTDIVSFSPGLTPGISDAAFMIGTGDLVRSPRLVRKCDRSIPPAGRSILSTADHTTTVHAVQSPRIGYRASRNRNTDASFRGCTRPHKWSAHQKARAHVSAPNADLSPTSHLLTTGGLPGLTGESNGTQIHFAARTFQRPRPDDYPDPRLEAAIEITAPANALAVSEPIDITP